MSHGLPKFEGVSAKLCKNMTKLVEWLVNRYSLLVVYRESF